MSLTRFAVLWGVLATSVIILAIYRMKIAGKTDELVHLGDTATDVVSQQILVEKKLEALDRWGKILTVLTVVSGLILGSFFMYQIWMQNSTTSGM